MFEREEAVTYREYNQVMQFLKRTDYDLYKELSKFSVKLADCVLIIKHSKILKYEDALSRYKKISNSRLV